MLGAGFSLLGFVLLMWTLGYLDQLTELWPLLPIVLGAVALVSGFNRDGTETTVFVGIFLTVGGTFFLLITTVGNVVDLSRIWPVFMTITGISLSVLSIRRNPGNRLFLLVPAVVMVLLSCVFFLFSLELVQRDFITVVTLWWPVLFVVIGVGMIVFQLIQRKRGGMVPEPE
ncbi:MAG: LiaI-LiaF-like domain-containing protein [Spirochaetota bacterium]